jgi:hypothetical protein
MRLLVPWFLLVWLLPSAARAADVVVRAGQLAAEISLDPWQLRFVDRQRGELLSEHPALGPQPSGPLGFRTAAGWMHALRAVSRERSRGRVSLLLETSDPEGRRMRVEVRRAGFGVIAVKAGLETGPDPSVEALGVGWQAPVGERYFGLGEHSTGVDFRGQTIESWSGEGPFQSDGGLDPSGRLPGARRRHLLPDALDALEPQLRRARRQQPRQLLPPRHRPPRRLELGGRGPARRHG